MVERFDRARIKGGYLRLGLVSGLTLLDCDENYLDRERWSYPCSPTSCAAGPKSPTKIASSYSGASPSTPRSPTTTTTPATTRCAARRAAGA